MRPSTLGSLLHQIPDQSLPFVTHYDARTGERTELSARTLDNWVAKTANFLIDECDAEAGTRVRVGLPCHWLRAVWVLSSWAVGASVVDRDAAIGVTGPDLSAEEPIKVASALRPFGLPFPEPPPGFLDIGVEVPSHGDFFVALDPPQPESIALDLDGTVKSHAELIADAAADPRRLLAVDGDVGRDAALLVAAALGGGSLVLVTGDPEEAAVARIAEQERVSDVWSGPLHSGE